MEGKEMKKIEIENSSNIKSVSYNDKNNKLEIEFHSGKIYQRDACSIGISLPP